MELGCSLLWTAMPTDLVVQGLEPQATALVEMELDGRLIQVLPGANGTATIQRLLSTDPFDYLDPRWQPGMVINLQQS